MSQAGVRSIETIQEFKLALQKFRVDADKALCAIDLHIRRFFDWLEDQAKGWQHEVRCRQDEVRHAREELARRRWFNKDGSGPGTTDQEEALEEAQRQLREAEDKVEACRRWVRQLPHEVTEYEGPARQLSAQLDGELPRALTLLDHKIAALEAYIQLTAPAAPAPATGESSMALPAGSEAKAGPTRTAGEYQHLRKKTLRPFLRGGVGFGDARGDRAAGPQQRLEAEVVLPAEEVLTVPGFAELSDAQKAELVNVFGERRGSSPPG
jgi:hypothetical protein